MENSITSDRKDIISLYFLIHLRKGIFLDKFNTENKF